MMKKLLLITLLFAGLTGFKHGNIRHINGTVYGKDDGLPLPGVLVKIDGTASGTQTNADGKYAVTVPEGKNILIFTYIGFKTQKVKIGKSDQLNIYMEAATSQLNEVVAVGYQARQKRDVTSSVAVISADAIVSAPPAYERSLQGKTAGVYIVSDKTTAKMKIRGMATPSAPTPVSDESYKGI